MRRGHADTAHGLLTFGECMGLISTPDIGPIEFAREFRFGIGGSESNVAIGAARLGAEAAWIGRIGTDATGDLIERRLTAEGVHAHLIRDDACTGIMLRHQRFGGHIQVDYHRAGSAASRLRPGDIPDALLRHAKILHITGITPALSASARDTVFDAVERARRFGTTVCFDVNYRAKLWKPAQARPVLRTLAAQADILLAGVDEARLVLGIRGSARAGDLARALAGLGPGEAIVKDGARGCIALIHSTPYKLAALTVPVLDPVGAGDAFTAAYLTEHLAGQAPEHRLRTAIAAGAYAVTVPGDCEGLPRRHELPAVLAAGEDAVR
jgi:2-dehydro-3-deoxygluconokinase